MKPDPELAASTPPADSDRPAVSCEQLFSSAVQLHLQGRVAQAEELYRKLLLVEPRHAAALHYLGVIALQRGSASEAADLIERSLAINEASAEGHYHLGLAFAGLRRFAETAAQNERAIALQPNYPEAYINLGNAWKVLGRANDAQAAYERAIALAPQTPEAHFNLANVLADAGQLDEAIACYEHALAARSVYPEALHNLGSALLLRGRHKEASERFRQALLWRPAFAEAMVGQALAFMIEDRSVEALGLLCRALAIKQTKEGKQLFAAWTQTVNQCPNVPGLRGVLAAALSEPWSRPTAFSRFAGAVLKSDGPVADLLARFAPAHLEQPDFRLAASDLAVLASDTLLCSLLHNAPVVDVPLESLMTAARRGLLAIAANGSGHEGIVPLACAIARQCFLDEYLFDFSESEIALATSHRDRLAAACRHGAQVSALRIATVAAYFPLHGIADCARLLERSWPEAVQALLVQQIREPQVELELRKSIARVTPISNRISLEVQRQYEENPYPRWTNTARFDSAPFDAYLRGALPLAQFRSLDKTPVEILNAGCGSGRHPIETAQRIAQARILAVDLSRTSLAYAERKTRELGLQNIEYAQADILQLADIGRSFDVTQSVGVLHHTADPWAAWRDLIALLRPGGFMEVGLYSERARGDFAAAQRFIQDRGLAADPDGIRRARRAIIALADDSPIKRTVLVPDFFTISGCRDFLFHVEEHQLTISQIKSFLIETGLAFLGFQLDRRVLGRYAARFPQDRTMADLDCWEIFEQENPDTFLAMYYFWVQKPA